MYIIENKSKLELIIMLIEIAAAVFIMKFIFGKIQTNGIWELLISNILFFLVLPIITIKYIFKKNITDYNLKKEISRRKAYVILTAVSIYAGVLTIAVLKFEWINFLEIAKWSKAGSWQLILFLDLLILPGIIFSQEFFYRGFIMETLRKNWGIYAAIILQSLIATGIKIYFDGGWKWQSLLIFGSMNLILGWIAYRSRWLVLSAAFRWAYFVGLDLFIIYKFHILIK